MIAFPVLDESADVKYQRPQSRTKRAVEAPGVVVSENLADDDKEREDRRVYVEDGNKVGEGKYRQRRRLKAAKEKPDGDE
jgi:hypothetical protein